MSMSPRILCGLVLVICLVLAADPIIAAPVDAASARSVAATFAGQAAGIYDRAAIVVEIADDPLIISRDGQDLAYLFRLAPGGYVVVAADDALPAVVAYSFDADPLEDELSDHPLLRLIAADLESRLQSLSSIDPIVTAERARQWTALRLGSWERSAEARFQQWPPPGSTPTGGWLLSNWTQNAPYNALCPLDLAHGGARSLAGCPAVAMAMILNYHETIQATAFGAGDRYWHAYAGNNFWIPDAAATYGFPDFPTLNGYLVTLTSHWGSGTPLTNTDKAALTFACGVAATQVYSASGSGTFGVGQAYNAYQRFAFTGSRLAFDTDPELYSDLALSMQNALPAHLAVVNEGWTMGHNVVVDGYNTDKYFHLNFGWGGAYNGWYLLPSEIPYGLTVIEGVILDIVPEATAVPGSPHMVSARSLTCIPNPATDRISLRLARPSAPDQEIQIFDAAGRLVRTLAGSSGGEIVWLTDDVEGRPVAPGVYLARASDGSTAARIVICR